LPHYFMKNTFGKGLESLIPKKSQKLSEKSEEKKEAVFSIEIEKIISNPYQPRKEFDREGLKTLAQSIRDYGILQPLVVTRIEKEGEIEYQLITGERRLMAAKMAGFSQVPVIIRQAPEREKLELSIIENVQRLDLNPMEKADAFQRLHDEFGFLQKDIARVCGTSREAVANTMRLLDLPEEIKTALREQKITEGHARAILGAKIPEKQKIVFSQTLRDGLNVREVESLVQKIEVYKPFPKKISTNLLEEIKNLEEKFREALQISDLKIRIEAGKPKLIIFFNTKKEIERFLKNLKPKI